jgi:hypothetical protein
MKTNGDILRNHADKTGMPRRSLAQVQDDLARCKARAKGKNINLDKSMARLMLNHGRLTDEARAWVAREYPQEG